ncbi:MAG: type II toxin-antitoxin system VapC family toxin [Nitrospirae bacterium]|nr:type II toxin-antitoxin system VapC family toxin [Nitrospirota bacterium]
MDILIDTNVYAAFKGNKQEAIELLQEAHRIYISTIVLGEILCGIQVSRHRKKNFYELNEFLDSPRVQLVEIDEKTAYFYSEIYKRLKQKGRPIPNNDMWISATAMRFGIMVASYDKHFGYVDGLLWHNPGDREV